jgi:hypothetical protein
MNIDRKKFYDAYREAFESLNQSQVDGLNQLLNMIEKDPEMVNIRIVAYILATVKHETAHTWQPIVEKGSKEYFDKYEPITGLGLKLGNRTMGDGYKYRGRGYVQLTGRFNYHKMSLRLSGLLEKNVDFVEYPDTILEPEIAYLILTIGMREGLFTGKRLSDYITTPRNYDFYYARRVVNGLDKANLIASYADSLLGILTDSVTDETAITETEITPPPDQTKFPAELLDKYMCAALTGLLANKNNDVLNYEDIARHSYEIAKREIEERNKHVK